MFRHIFELVDGVAVYPVIALIIFFTFFLLMLWWLVQMDRDYVRHMEELPLDNPSYSNNGGKQHG